MTPHIPSLPSLQTGSGKAASPYMLSNRLPKLVLPGSGGHASLRSHASAQVRPLCARAVHTAALGVEMLPLRYVLQPGTHHSSNAYQQAV